MTILRAFICFTLTCGVVWPQCNHKIVAESGPWLPEIVRIQSALNVFDPSKDDLVAYREALNDALFLGDAKVQEQVRRYLLEYWRWVPLVSFEDIVESWGESTPENAAVASALLDLPRWWVKPREARKSAYERCLGGRESSHRRLMTASVYVCIGSAASEGFADLMPLIRSAYERLSPGEQNAAPLEYLELESTLCSNAVSRDDALKLKSQAIRNMPIHLLATRTMEDRAWAILVTNVTREACAGRLGNPECSTMADVMAMLAQQWEDSPAPASTESSIQVSDWLDRLRKETAPARQFKQVLEWHMKGRPVTPFGHIDEMAYYQQIRAEKARRRHSK